MLKIFQFFTGNDEEQLILARKKYRVGQK